VEILISGFLIYRTFPEPVMFTLRFLVQLIFTYPDPLILISLFSEVKYSNLFVPDPLDFIVVLVEDPLSIILPLPELITSMELDLRTKFNSPEPETTAFKFEVSKVTVLYSFPEPLTIVFLSDF
jgi:hypothetical protein